MFYTHPWEFDPDQPRIRGAGFKSRSRHYVGLKRTRPRIIKMLERYRFGAVSEVLANDQRSRHGSIFAGYVGPDSNAIAS